MASSGLSSSGSEKERGAPARREARRWIVIGEAERAYVVIGNCGYPDGWKMRWRGSVDWCQPCQFIRDEDLISAIKTRLRIAGLAPIQIQGMKPFGAPDTVPMLIRVQVRRLCHPSPIGDLRT